MLTSITMTPVAPAPGLSVAGKYELIRPLARGSMGQVWVARHSTLEGELAIKFLTPQTGIDAEDGPTALARFQFEAQVAARLSRKTRHIISVSDHGVEFGFAYLVMELIEGESLESRMRRIGHAELSFVATLVAQLAKGLSQAHAEGLFHRDLKPANVILTRDEDGAMIAKILDFGIAKATRKHVASREGPDHSAPGHETEVGIVLGTPNYMSPEQARGLASLDHRCDVWALATLAYEALTGTLPYDGETTADLLVNICTVESVPVRTHRPDLPPSADAVFEKAFRRKIGERYQQASELAEALTTLEAEARVSTKKTSIVPAADPRTRETDPAPESARGVREPAPVPLLVPASKTLAASARSAAASSQARTATEGRSYDAPSAATLQGSEVDAPPLKGRTVPLVALALVIAVALVLLIAKVSTREEPPAGDRTPTQAPSSGAAPSFVAPPPTNVAQPQTTALPPTPTTTAPSTTGKQTASPPPTSAPPPTSTASNERPAASAPPAASSSALAPPSATAPPSPTPSTSTKKIDQSQIL